MADVGVRIRFVRVWLDDQRIEVAVDDVRVGKKRLIKYRWMTQSPDSSLPANWYESIKGEVQYQRGHEDRVASGRALPWKAR